MNINARGPVTGKLQSMTRPLPQAAPPQLIEGVAKAAMPYFGRELVPGTLPSDEVVSGVSAKVKEFLSAHRLSTDGKTLETSVSDRLLEVRQKVGWRPVPAQTVEKHAGQAANDMLSAIGQGVYQTNMGPAM